MTFSSGSDSLNPALSAADLQSISTTINQQYSPRFRSRFANDGTPPLCANDLLSISREIRRDHSPVPGQFAMHLVLLPIAPGRLYAYWHLPTSVNQDDHLKLRIYPLAEAESVKANKHENRENAVSIEFIETADTVECFELEIKPQQQHVTINIPPAIATNRGVRALLGQQMPDSAFKPLLDAGVTQTTYQTKVALALLPALTAYIMPDTDSSSSVSYNPASAENFINA